MDARTGEPIAGALVMAARSRRGALDEDWIGTRKQWWRESETGDELAGAPPAWIGLSVSAKDGSFELLYSYTTSTSTRGCLGITRRSGYGPYRGAEFLRIELPGREPIVVEAPRRGWSEEPTEVADKRWDMGDIRVP